MVSSPKAHKRTLVEMNKQNEWQSGVIVNNDNVQQLADQYDNLECYSVSIDSDQGSYNEYKFPKVGESPNSRNCYGYGNGEPRKLGILAENHIQNRIIQNNIILQNNFHGNVFKNSSNHNNNNNSIQSATTTTPTNTSITNNHIKSNKPISFLPTILKSQPNQLIPPPCVGTSSASSTTTPHAVLHANTTANSVSKATASRITLQKIQEKKKQKEMLQKESKPLKLAAAETEVVSKPSQSSKDSSEEKKKSSVPFISKFSSVKLKKKSAPLVYGQVLYNYDADSEEELSLIKGDSIIITEQCADGWWKGRHYLPVESDKQGIFPQNYVTILPGDPKLSSSASTSVGTSSSLLSEMAQELPISYSIKDDPKIFFVTSPEATTPCQSPGSCSSPTLDSSMGSYGSTCASPTPCSPNSQRIFPIQIKIYIPPFLEHTIIQMNNIDTLNDILPRIVIKKELIQEGKCSFRYSNCVDGEPLSLSQIISSLREPKKLGLRLYIEGMDYQKLHTPSSSNSSSSIRSNSSNSSNDELLSSSLSSSLSSCSSPRIRFLSGYFVLLNNKERYYVQYDQQSIQIKKTPNDQPIRILSLAYTDIEANDKSLTLMTPFHIFTFLVPPHNSTTSNFNGKGTINQNPGPVSIMAIQVQLSTPPIDTMFWLEVLRSSKDQKDYLKFLKKTNRPKFDSINLRSSSSSLQFALDL
ncbi:pleckstrin (PH) domain-containing protein [Tieghemostelium lacteum]|uniref:Pleckstrin (PH) domain-containing protein n=1 Tax=Tieghemostelium lacteum TaxID=361077 RepID=A0A151Z6J6_TIELA|nr:pleckstrin (PH) domain-containing protein [Tieghemostelium lacteum]|eukprot:KYQ89589.1 pleckstrin (PH) domain-containing protein [Tieghemostelium lacteum]